MKLHSLFRREVEPRESLPNIWEVYGLIKSNIIISTTYDQLQNCEAMIQALLLDKYTHMPLSARICAIWLRKRIQDKEKALFYDLINENV